jgi:uncharacterized protein with FMN-binding domain
VAARVAALRDGRRPRHPTHGARTVALAASVASTISVALALTVADRTDPAPTTTSATVAAAGTAAPSATTTGGATATPTTTAKAAAAAKFADGTWTGTAEYTKWGYVQVRATVVGGRLTDVVAVQSPTDRKSANINASAQPVLESEAIAQQDAALDMVSGATFTSRTYTASLQAALDRAAAAVPSAASTRSQTS